MTASGKVPREPRSGRWADLGPRIGSSLALIALAVGAIYMGGLWFMAFVAVMVGIVTWELAQMTGIVHALALGGLAGACSAVLSVVPDGYGLPLVMVPMLAGIGRAKRQPLAFALFSVMVLLAGYGLVDLRENISWKWLVWLVCIVAATDIAGYFAGRLIGGPRFWPKVSPKKTWSGTVAGWIAAALVGVVAWRLTMSGPQVIGISIALSMASQLGDIAESALKRQLGVKDSSNLLPGHGGFFDRFDGVLGAAVFFLIVEQVVPFPPGAV
ncbi:MAG: phosphatidate cytidylyltransferase [Rhodobacteraceae bacterium]|nr:phosphatidate cytidylyltransferase [Paracoccaceae bacterium]